MRHMNSLQESSPAGLWQTAEAWSGTKSQISSETLTSFPAKQMCILQNLWFSVICLIYLIINKSTFSYRSTMALSCFLYRFKFPMFGWFGQIPKNIQSWKLLDCWHFLLLTNCIQKSPWSRINLVNPSKKFFFFLSVALK